MLTLECCRVCCGDAAPAESAAIAVECVHTFSLVHDDLPEMDNDDLRRGRPTAHRQFDPASALLAGDWLLAHAMDVALCGAAPADAVRIGRTLAQATQAMVHGQSADMLGEKAPANAELVAAIHRDKTARLMEAACVMGAIAGGADDDVQTALGAYGLALGQAFQIVDDLLDVTASAEELGKRAGKDAAVKKQTYPAVFGVERSRVEAKRCVERALAALAPFGAEAARLRSLAEYVLTRSR